MECWEKPHPHSLSCSRSLCAPAAPWPAASLILTPMLKQRALARSGGGVGVGWGRGGVGGCRVGGLGLGGAVGSSSLGYSIGSQSRSSGVSQVGWHLPSLLRTSGFGTLVLPRGGACGECTRDSLELQEVAGPIGICLTTLA